MRAGPISAWSILLRDGDAPKQSERFGTDQSQRGDPDSHVKHALARHSPHDRLIRPSGREATRHPTPFATSAVPWANCLDVVLPGRGEICPTQLVQPTHPRRRTGVQRRCPGGLLQGSRTIKARKRRHAYVCFQAVVSAQRRVWMGAKPTLPVTDN